MTHNNVWEANFTPPPKHGEDPHTPAFERSLHGLEAPWYHTIGIPYLLNRRNDFRFGRLDGIFSL